MRARVMAMVGVVAVFAVGCGAADPGVTATRSRQGAGGGGSQLIPTDPTTPGGTTPIEKPDYEIIPGVVDFGTSKPPHDYDAFLTNAFGDIQEYWKDAYPEVYGAPFENLSGGIYAAYPDRAEPIPGCGTDSSSYRDVANYGAFYCILGDFMAYDDAGLLPSLVAELGQEAVAIVLAHEFGHAVQARADEWKQPVVLKEQQADCFAGAWAAHVASGGSDLIRFTDADVRAGLIAMINVRDPVDGDGLANPQAHGTGFDRVGAFQDGFRGGAVRCKTLFVDGRINELVDLPFDREDPNAGNLPLIDPNPTEEFGPQDIVTLIPRNLDFFWTDLAAANGVPFTPPTFSPFPAAGPLPNCAGVDQDRWVGNATFCAADNTIYWDQDAMATLAGDPFTGDMSVGYLFSTAYSDAIQVALRRQKTGEARALFNDCLTGAWVIFILPPIPADREDQLILSAGDLDEAIITAIGRSDASSDTNVLGSAFEKVDAFRVGVQGGLNVCVSTFG